MRHTALVAVVAAVGLAALATFYLVLVLILTTYRLVLVTASLVLVLVHSRHLILYT